MDIQESLRRILEQKQAVTHRFFTVALGGGPDGYFVFVGAETDPQPRRPTYVPLTGSAPRTIYEQFTQDLLRTLQEFHGAEWNAELMTQWQKAIEHVGRAILGG
jgi:hypothetical protein